MTMTERLHAWQTMSSEQKIAAWLQMKHTDRLAARPEMHLHELRAARRDAMSAVDWASAMLGSDPIAGLEGIGNLRRTMRAHEERHVRAARRRGVWWQEIADALGVRVQTAHERWARALARDRGDA